MNVTSELTGASCLSCKRVMEPISIDRDGSIQAWLCGNCMAVVQPRLEWNIFTQKFDTELTDAAW